MGRQLCGPHRSFFCAAAFPFRGRVGCPTYPMVSNHPSPFSHDNVLFSWLLLGAVVCSWWAPSPVLWCDLCFHSTPLRPTVGHGSYLSSRTCSPGYPPPLCENNALVRATSGVVSIPFGSDGAEWVARAVDARGCRNREKKKLGVSNTPYDGGQWVTDGGWWVTDGGWWVTDGGWWVTDGGWWVATKHQRVDAIVKKRGGGGERPYGTPWSTPTGSERACGMTRDRTPGGPQPRDGSALLGITRAAPLAAPSQEEGHWRAPTPPRGFPPGEGRSRSSSEDT